MNIPPQNPKKRIDTRTNRKRPPSKSRQTLEFLGIEETPLTKPTKYMIYGGSSYKILSYAKFRGERMFTTTDYREFCAHTVTAKSADAALQHLTKCGYVTKHDKPYDPKHPNVKNLYRITMVGEHALMYLGRKRREQEEAEQRRLGRIYGQLGLDALKQQQSPLI
jgi:hypothetical protein